MKNLNMQIISKKSHPLSDQYQVVTNNKTTKTKKMKITYI